MPYIFGIDLIFITADNRIRTLGIPLLKKGIIFDYNGYYPIVRVNPLRF